MSTIRLHKINSNPIFTTLNGIVLSNETVWQASAVSISLRRQGKKFFIFDDKANHDHLAIKTSFLVKKKKKKNGALR